MSVARRAPARPRPRGAGRPDRVRPGLGNEIRWRFTPPLQARARATVEAFAAAAEKLLRDRPFEAIGVHEMARLAGRTTGAFYARFSSKDGLLPYLYRRYDAGLETLMRRRMARHDWAALDFDDAVHALVEVLVGLYVERRWFLRAMALFVRANPDALEPDVYDRRRRVRDTAVEALRPHRAAIAHDDPDEAVRFGVFMISAAAREKLLFADAPHARVTAVSQAGLVDGLSRALRGYLAASPTRPAGAGTSARSPRRHQP